ncbi:MAG: glycosyltransferase [Yoonia sp.]|uniref:glycosyltransferase n=1 Tax=Yoonia sp. TaxID=2212373 RepID=UPI003EF786A2
MTPITNPRSLFALVVTHNRLSQLQTTIARLLAVGSIHLVGVVVFDNASSDGTAQWLAQQNDPRLHVISSAENLGGAGGFAQGLAHISDTFDPDWIVVMDDDGRPQDVALEAFHALDVTGWDALAAAVYFPAGGICEMNRPSRNPFWHMPEFLRVLTGGGRQGFHLTSDQYDADDVIQIDVTSFVGFFISREGIALAGYPDAGLFIYGDDGIYTLGLSRAGGRIGFAPQIAFEHDFTTVAGGSKRMSPMWKVYYHHRNLLMLYRQAAGWFFVPVLLVILPKWITKVRHYSGDRRVFMRLIVRAIVHGLFRRTDIAHQWVLTWAGETLESQVSAVQNVAVKTGHQKGAQK